MELGDLAAAARRRWRWIVAATVLGAALAAALAFVPPVQYESTARLYATPSDSTDETLSSTTATYLDLSRSTVVARGTIDQLDLGATPRELLRNTSVASPPDSSILEVSGRSSTPRGARAVADTYARVVIAYVAAVTRGGELAPGSLDLTEAPTSSPLTLVQQADDPTAVRPVPPPAALALGLLVGLGVGVALAAVVDRRRPRIRSSRDVVAADPRATLLGALELDASFPPTASSVSATDQFRHLAAALTSSFPTGPRTICLSDVDQGGSAGSVGAHLAAAIAETGASVTLVDVDMRQQRLSQLLVQEPAPGLTDELKAVTPAAPEPRAIASGITLVTPGSDVSDPGALLGSPGLQEILAEVSTWADWTLLVAPPVSEHLDAAILGRRADAVVVPVELGSNDPAVLTSVIDAVESIGAPTPTFVTTVTNRARRKRASRHATPA